MYYWVIVFHPCPSGQCVPGDVRYWANDHEVRPDGVLVIRRRGRFVAAMKPGEWEDLRQEAAA